MAKQTLINTDKSAQSQQETAETPFLSIEEVSKVYPTPTGSYVVLEGVNLTVSEGVANQHCSIWFLALPHQLMGQ
jgi:hypothetical protein